MTFTQLRCFIEVARQLNFARAAETLYISQPAVSRQIHALENELGVRLFDRTRHVVALTSAGESFYHDTVDMLDRLTLAVQRAQNTQALFSEELHVGYSGSMQIQKLPQIYQQYQKRCPQVHILNDARSGPQWSRSFDKSVPDIVFDSRDDLPADSILEYRSLYHGKMVCVMYEEHPLAKHKTVTLEQLNGEVLILLDMAHISARMTTAQELIRQKCPQAVYYFSSSSEHALPMIQGHVGLAVMPDFCVCTAAGPYHCAAGAGAGYGVWHCMALRLHRPQGTRIYKDRLCRIRRKIVTQQKAPAQWAGAFCCV